MRLGRGDANARSIGPSNSHKTEQSRSRHLHYLFLHVNFIAYALVRPALLGAMYSGEHRVI